MPPPRSNFMAPAVGSVAHGFVNAFSLAERARTAHRQKKEPWPLTPIVSPGFRVTNFCFLFFVFLTEALKKNKVCPVVEKRSRQIPKRLFLLEQSYLTSAGNPVSGNREFHLAPSKTMVEQVKKGVDYRIM